MQARFRRLQQLMTPLRVFEAAARHLSFTRAAHELNLSQPSVSRHVAALEHDLATHLFQRDHNRLVLTNAGRTLALATERGLSDILTAMEAVSSKTVRNGFVLACTQTFAHGWLMPRFSALRRASGDVPISLKVSFWLEDINLDEIDMVIGWHPDSLTNWPRLPLFSEQIYPVCAPEMASELSASTTPQALRDKPLLHFDRPEQAQIAWLEWFAHNGVDYSEPKDAYLHSNYQFAVQAAIDGDGIALGWHHFVADHVAAGRLVRVGPIFTPPNGMRYLEYRSDSLSGEDMSAILDWFRAQAS